MSNCQTGRGDLVSARGGKGGSRKAGGGGAELPEGVRETDPEPLLKEYEFEVAGQPVIMSIDGDGSNRSPAEVFFFVGRDFPASYDKGKLEGRDAVRAALTLRRIMQYDVSKRPDGFLYTASAWTGDGGGDQRMNSYIKMGFSVPEFAGKTQYAVVRNGKLTPYTP